MKLSIVIPVYNVEDYITKCLESVINQGLEQNDYEIIIVNDGSPDHSMDVVADFVESHKGLNVKVINQQNSGVGAARNKGLSAATGKYVFFLDSDDWIEPNCIPALIEYADNNNLDVLCFAGQYVYPDGKTSLLKVSHEESGKIYNGEDFICVVGMSSSSNMSLYSIQYLRNNGVRYYEGILYEDREFTPRSYVLADRIAYVNKICYNYYFKRQNSITNSKNYSRYSKDYLKVADSLCSFAEEHFRNNERVFKKFMEFVMISFTRSIVYNTGSVPYSAYKSKHYYPFDLDNIQDQRIVKKGRLANISLRMFHICSKILHKS